MRFALCVTHGEFGRLVTLEQIACFFPPFFSKPLNSDPSVGIPAYIPECVIVQVRARRRYDARGALPVKLDRIIELHCHLLYHHHYYTGPQVQKRSHKHSTPIIKPSLRIQPSPKGRPKRTSSRLSVMIQQKFCTYTIRILFFSNTF